MPLNSRAALLLVLSVMLACPLLMCCSGQPPKRDFDFKSVVSSIDAERVRKHILFFASLKSRFTGYPGCNEAAEYIRHFFEDLGLNVTLQRFSVVVPVDHGASLRVLPEGRSFRIYPLWPNMVSPPTIDGSIVGRLVYVGSGTFSEISRACKSVNVSITEAILLMDLDSGMRWLDAAELGAKAVIFLGRDDIKTHELRTKFLDTAPFNYPRFYAPAEISGELLELAANGALVELTSNVTWEEREAANVIAFLKGTRYPDKLVLFTSYYDSFSYVPSLSPGAQEACGISTLLEIARFFSKHPPIYSIVFAAFSGHNLGLVGSRNFVQEYVFNRWKSFGSRIQAVVNLDLHTDSDVIAPTYFGGFYGGKQKITSRLIPYIIEEIMPEVERQLGRKFNYTDAGMSDFSYLDLFETPFPYDHEPFALAWIPSVSIMTGYVLRQRWGTPSDLPKYLNMKNLKTQLEAVACILYAIANTPNLVPEYCMPSDERPLENSFWAIIEGVVAEYNYSKAWYEPIPHILFLARTSGAGFRRVSYLISAGLWLYTFSDENGRVRIVGAGSVSYSIYQSMYWMITAFGVDPRTGNVNLAPDRGLHRFSEDHFYIREGGGKVHDFGYFTVFRCGSIVIFDIIDPFNLNVPTGFYVQVNEVESHSRPESYGISTYVSADGSYALAVVFVEPGEPVEIVWTAPYAARYPLALLLNASERCPAGRGYKVEAGSQLVITYTPLKYAESFYWLDVSRLRRAALPSISEHLWARSREVRKAIEESIRLAKSHDYALAYNSMLEAWQKSWALYSDIKKVKEDSVLTLPFFAALLIPFAFLAERLLFESRGVKRVALLVLIYVALCGFLWILHPGFRLADDPFAILLGCMGVILMALPVGIVVSKVLELFKELFRKAHGPRFSTIGRATRIALAFSLGVHNMRLRRFRTSLMMVSIVLMTLGLASFTSITTKAVVMAYDIGRPPAYAGILLKYPKEMQGRPLGSKVLEMLKTEYGEAVIVAPRMWRYPLKAPFRVVANGKVSYASAISGVTYKEVYFTNVNNTLIAGRWFEPGDTWVCIIGSHMAEMLGIRRLPATISLMGCVFKVIGIVDDEKVDALEDLDGLNPITPIDLKTPGAPSMSMWGLEGGVVIVPYKTLERLGGSIGALAIRVRNESLIREMAEEIFKRYGLETYFSIGNHTYVFSRAKSYVATGAVYQLVPTLLIVLSLLNMLIASVYERVREIRILSSVGLSPLDVAAMFLAESAVYGILGGVLGYVAAMGIMSGLSGTLRGLALNPSSSTVALSVGVAILATIASAIYPAFKASRVVVPSLERRWRIPTKPRGDEWTIPLPFVARDERELDGIMAFTMKLIRDHMGEEMPVFTTKEARFTVERRGDAIVKRIDMLVSLPPREAAIRQSASFMGIMSRGGREIKFLIKVRRLSGAYSAWRRANYEFVDAIRKHLLQWRALSPDEREKYIRERLGVEG